MSNHCATARLAKIMRRNETVRVSNILSPNGEYTKSTAETINCLLDTLAPGSREARCIHAVEETDKNIEVTMDDEIVNSICSLEKMERAINEFLPFKTPGPDGIYPVLLQRGWNNIKNIYQNILQTCLKCQLCANSMEGRDWYLYP